MPNGSPVLHAPAFLALSSEDVLRAQSRIAPHIHRTPLVTSPLLNEWLGHEVHFKLESQQAIGAFKIRGALNALLSLAEQNCLPKRVVAVSSGNHAQAVARACAMLGCEATVVMPKFVSQVKQIATRGYGAKLILTDTRQEADAQAHALRQQDAYFIHPSDDDAVIAGQGTACLEALQDGAAPEAIFATCGGGGLLSGSWLAAQALAPQAAVFGAEPKIANDAARSYASGSIVAFEHTPMTIADGARTLHVSERTFYYLRQLAGFYEAEEEQIIYWSQWLSHVLKVSVEPTSAVAMAAAFEWLKTQSGRKRALVIISGGNIDAGTQQAIWSQDYLTQRPSLRA